MKRAGILPYPVPCAVSNSADNVPEYNTRALTSVYKSLMANHSLPLIPKSENNLYINPSVYVNEKLSGRQEKN